MRGDGDVHSRVGNQALARFNSNVRASFAIKYETRDEANISYEIFTEYFADAIAVYEHTVLRGVVRDFLLAGWRTFCDCADQYHRILDSKNADRRRKLPGNVSRFEAGRRERHGKSNVWAAPRDSHQRRNVAQRSSAFYRHVWAAASHATNNV